VFTEYPYRANQPVFYV